MTKENKENKENLELSIEESKKLIPAHTSSENQGKSNIQEKIADIDKAPDEMINRLPPNSLTRRLFPTPIVKHLQQHELRAISIETNFRENVLQIARNAQLKAIDEMYQDFIQKGKARVQVDRQKIFLELMQEAQKHIEQQTIIFAETMAKGYDRLDTIKIEKLKQKEQERLEKTIERFYDTFDAYPERLQEILNQNLT